MLYFYQYNFTNYGTSTPTNFIISITPNLFTLFGRWFQKITHLSKLIQPMY